MYLKQFIKNTNLILISHGFGKQTQFIESLLDGHSRTIQFPTNYKNYFLNLKSKNFKDAINEFVAEDPGYVYDIFNHHQNRYLIVNRSRVVPMIEDRDCFFFNIKSLEKIKNKPELKKYYNFVKKNLNRKFKKKFLFKQVFFNHFKTYKNFNKIFLLANPVYSLDQKKFIGIYLKLINDKLFNLKYNKKNLLLLLHYTLCVYLNKNPKKIKYIIFNLHDYTNIHELISDFKDCTHIAVAEDFKVRFSRNKFKKGTHYESVVQYCYESTKNISKYLGSLSKKNNYLFFNEYISKQKEKFVDKLLKILKLKKEKICYKPTFLGIQSYGNSRNEKILNTFSSDMKYNDWWNYLSFKEIFFLDYYYRNFFLIFRNCKSENFDNLSSKFGIFKKLFYQISFLPSDYLYFLKTELKTQSQLSKSSLSNFSYYRIFRTPLKIIIFTFLYPLVFLNKINSISKINSKFKGKKYNLKIFQC